MFAKQFIFAINDIRVQTKGFKDIRAQENKDAVQVQVRFIICRLDAIKDTLYIKIICKTKTKITFFTTGDWKGPVRVI